LAILGNRIFQLTWTSQKGFIYGFDSFALQSEFAYRGEGWGLTEDGAFLIMSDGTSQIRFLDPANLHTTRVISVMDGDRPIERLNELEYVQGQIFANVWQTDLIVCINPINGNVVKWIDLAGLLPLEDRMRYTDVLNGIAYDRNGDRLFATGKFWPKLFQIRLRRSDRK
jgi:glutamine cyclotransferase